ncbi:MAG: metallopeptidase family protein [Verrucomicrobia bacterium]|nr:metallopeptidase family protein [Verrucomicrobiota bacterium]
MNLAKLTRLAEQTVAATLRELPPPVQPVAQSVPVICQDWPSDEVLGDEFEPDILGLFVGPPHGAPSDDAQGLPPQILLFIGNLWDFAGEDPEIFRDEVRLTYLHELGHYLGWDEDELTARGLD